MHVYLVLVHIPAKVVTILQLKVYLDVGFYSLDSLDKDIKITVVVYAHAYVNTLMQSTFVRAVANNSIVNVIVLVAMEVLQGVAKISV